MEKEENLSQDIKTPESTGDDGKDVTPLSNGLLSTKSFTEAVEMLAG